MANADSDLPDDIDALRAALIAERTERREVEARAARPPRRTSEPAFGWI